MAAVDCDTLVGVIRLAQNRIEWVVFAFFFLGVLIWGNFIYHILARVGVFRKKIKRP
jgi:hypothetical protein